MEEEIKKKINEIHVELNGSSSVKHITATSTFQALSQMLSKNDEEKKNIAFHAKSRTYLHITNEESKKNQPKSCHDYGKNYFSRVSGCGKILSQGTAPTNLHTSTKKDRD